MGVAPGCARWRPTLRPLAPEKRLDGLDAFGFREVVVHRRRPVTTRALFADASCLDTVPSPRGRLRTPNPAFAGRH
jgi:hypothetical protein